MLRAPSATHVSLKASYSSCERRKLTIRDLRLSTGISAPVAFQNARRTRRTNSRTFALHLHRRAFELSGEEIQAGMSKATAFTVPSGGLPKGLPEITHFSSGDSNAGHLGLTPRGTARLF